MKAFPAPSKISAAFSQIISLHLGARDLSNIVYLQLELKVIIEALMYTQNDPMIMIRIAVRRQNIGHDFIKFELEKN